MNSSSEVRSPSGTDSGPRVSADSGPDVRTASEPEVTAVSGGEVRAVSRGEEGADAGLNARTAPGTGAPTDARSASRSNGRINARPAPGTDDRTGARSSSGTDDPTDAQTASGTNDPTVTRSASRSDDRTDARSAFGTSDRAGARSNLGTHHPTGTRTNPGTHDPTAARTTPGTDTPTAPRPGPRVNSRTGAALALRGATLGRPGAPVLDALDLDVSPGEILTVVGPSGCGKSTLLRTLAGLLHPLSGEVSQDGRPLAGPGADRALIFQDDALLPWRTLRANVELPLAIKKLPRADRRAQAEVWLDRVGLGAQAGQLPHRVSGGQRQRAQLARALAGAPRAVLMDEPFGALDAQTRAGMQDLLVEVLCGTGATVVFVTHDVDEALYLGDRLALLGAGRLLAVREVPRPRDRAAHDDPARVALRRDVLTSLGT